jgi:tetratricopeptide (TPR) repeat protein
LNALSQIATKFRTRVGESLATVQQHSTPLQEATTGSLDALKAYSMGWKVAYSLHDATSVPHFLRALQIDRQFAAAYASLGRTYADFGEFGLAAQNLRKAYELRERVSDAERFFIIANYEMQVTGNLEKAHQAFESWQESYPRALDAPGLLSGQIYPTFGMYEKAVEAAKRAIALDPDFPFAYVNLGAAYICLNRWKDAADAVGMAAARKVSIPEILLVQFDLAFLTGDAAGMDRAMAQGRGKSGAEDWLVDHAAFAQAYSGHLRLARKMARGPVEEAQGAGQPERAAMFQAGAALWEAFFGNAAEAKQTAAAALKLSQGRDVQYGAGLAMELAGDSRGAQTLADQLEKAFPEDTSVRYWYLPVLRAQRAVNRGEWANALQLLEPAGRYELGLPGSVFNGNFGALYPAYVRGEAYLGAGKGAEAAAEFQKFADHRGVINSDPIGALARLQLGRALALSGDAGKAKAAYADFLNLWKDGDAEIPILKAARAEYAKLSAR